jgi:hypothetical protein
LPPSIVEAGIAVNARPEPEPPGGLGNRPAVPTGAFISGGVYLGGQLALTAPDPRGYPRGDATPGADGDLSHGSSSFLGS